MTNNENKKRVNFDSDDSERGKKKIKLEHKHERKRSSKNLNSISDINEHCKKIKLESTCPIQRQDINTPSININTKENRLKRKNINIQKRLVHLSIPRGMIHLSPEHIKYLKESYPKRSYYGAASNICKYCGAIFWFEERIRHERNRDRNIIYTQCCREGKIKIPPFKDPPEFLSTLLQYNE